MAGKIKRDIYQEVTDKVIVAMESGVAPWARDWTGGAGVAMPRRSTGENYRGINILLLWIAAMEKGFNSDQWFTFNQAKADGGMVRKGSKGTQIVFFNIIKKECPKTGEETKIPFLKYYTVFNRDQIDGLPESGETPVNPDTGAKAIEALDSFFAQTGMALQITGGQPCYIPALDVVQMPAVSQFNSAESYYGTLAHESIHWTGHKSRLDRFSKTSQKRTEYAFEELVAELGAVFLCTMIGAEKDVNRSAAYLQSWLGALRDDKKFIFQAASAASAASDYMLDAGGYAANPLAIAA